MEPFKQVAHANSSHHLSLLGFLQDGCALQRHPGYWASWQGSVGFHLDSTQCISQGTCQGVYPKDGARRQKTQDPFSSSNNNQEAFRAAAMRVSLQKPQLTNTPGDRKEMRIRLGEAHLSSFIKYIRKALAGVTLP